MELYGTKYFDLNENYILKISGSNNKFVQQCFV